MEKNVSNIKSHMGNEQYLNAGLILKLNMSHLREKDDENLVNMQINNFYNECESSMDKRDSTHSVSYENVRLDSSENFLNLSKEILIEQNNNSQKDQNDEMNAKNIVLRKVIYPRKNYRNKNNLRKRHLKVRHNARRIETKKNSNDLKQELTRQPIDLEKEEIVASNLQNFDLETDNPETVIDNNDENKKIILQSSIEDQNSSPNLSNSEQNGELIYIIEKMVADKSLFDKQPSEMKLNENVDDVAQNVVAFSPHFSYVNNDGLNNKTITNRFIQNENSKQIFNKTEISSNDNSIAKRLPDNETLQVIVENTAPVNEMICTDTKVISNHEKDCTVLTKEPADTVFSNKSESGILFESVQSNNHLIKNPGRIIRKGVRTYKNFKNELVHSTSLELTVKDFNKPSIDTKAEKNVNIISVPSLNERKIQLAEELPLKTAESVNEVSTSEISSCEELTEINSRNEHSGTANDGVQSKANEVITNITSMSNPFTHEENNIPDESLAKSDLKFKSGIQTLENATSEVDGIAKVSESIKHDDTRNALIRLWKEENNKIYEIFPKYRSTTKRKIIHLEKELRTNRQTGASNLAIVDIKQNEFLLQTEDGDAHISAKVKVTCKYPSTEYEENNEKEMQTLVHSENTANSNENLKCLEDLDVSNTSVTESNLHYDALRTYGNFDDANNNPKNLISPFYDDISSTSNQSLDNRSDISEEGLDKLKTPLTGSSEDSNFHFHQSTSPSDQSSDISEESGEVSSTYQNSIDFSINQMHSKGISGDKNIFLDENTDEINDFSAADSSENIGGVKWVSGIICEKSDKIPDIQQVSSHIIEKELGSTSSDINLKGSNSSMENNTKHHEKVDKCKLSSENENFSDVVDMYFNDNHGDVLTSNAQMNSSEDVVFSAENYDADEIYFQKENPLKYHLKYKNLDLQVLDSSTSLTIRLVDEKSDYNPSLKPTWKRFVSNSLFSSNSSINMLELPSAMSSNSSGETIKADINVSEGKLQMQVRESDLEGLIFSPKVHENIKSKYDNSSKHISNEVDKTVNGNNTQIPAQTSLELLDNINENKNGDGLLSHEPKNESVKNGNIVPVKSPSTFINETEILTDSLNDKVNKYFDEQHFDESEILKSHPTKSCDTNIEQCVINEEKLPESETTVIQKNECSEDLQFNARGIKFTCKPTSELDSVEVKFRQMDDKTKLTFKSGCKKLYLKMSPKV